MKRMIPKLNLLLIATMILPVVLAQTNPPSVDVPNQSPYADTEATTNVVFNAGDSDDKLFRLSLELNATADNDSSVPQGG